MENREIKPFHEGFTLGISKAVFGEIADLEKELKKALGIKNKVSYTAYKYGRIRVRAEQAQRVEHVFQQFGVPVEFVWGKAYLPQVRLTPA